MYIVLPVVLYQMLHSIIKYSIFMLMKNELLVVSFIEKSHKLIIYIMLIWAIRYIEHD